VRENRRSSRGGLGIAAYRAGDDVAAARV